MRKAIALRSFNAIKEKSLNGVVPFGEVPAVKAGETYEIEASSLPFVKKKTFKLRGIEHARYPQEAFEII